MKIKSLLASAFALFTLGAQSLYAGSYADDVLNELQTMKGVYNAEYAPAKWKKTFANYDLNDQYVKAVTAVQAKPNLTQKEGREILKNFIYAMKDYHTSISFHSTESATLPFTVRGTDTKFFIVNIDRSKVPESSFPFHVGDELVTFDGRPTTQAVADVQNQIPANVPTTDKALAEVRLTSRKAASGIDVPQGPVTLGVTPAGSQTISEIQLLWDYKPEEIKARVDSLDIFQDKARPLSAIFRPQMNVELGEDSLGNPYDLGAKQTWIPDLGPKLWQSADDDIFYAYMYRTPDRKIIGYIRLPSYGASDFLKASAEFQRDIINFEHNADGLVIDQVNNPGGSVLYLYNLISMLTPEPLIAPRHRISVTQEDVDSAIQTRNLLQNIKTDDDAKKLIPAAELQGFPVSYEFSRFLLHSSLFTISEWNAGRHFTNPYWIMGVDHINPASNHFSKPILVLVNELDFSGGDFFPTILQDSKRATIFGTRTAGAGGYVKDIDVPNNIGVDKFRCTESIAERVDQNPIENLGVTPDVPYVMTERDFSQNYPDYVKAVQKAIGDIVP